MNRLIKISRNSNKLQIKKTLQLKKKKSDKKRKFSSKKKINWQQGDNEFDRQDVNRGGDLNHSESK
jgi:predicted secreted Zn-dependent protease